MDSSPTVLFWFILPWQPLHHWGFEQALRVPLTAARVSPAPRLAAAGGVGCPVGSGEIGLKPDLRAGSADYTVARAGLSQAAAGFGFIPLPWRGYPIGAGGAFGFWGWVLAPAALPAHPVRRCRRPPSDGGECSQGCSDCAFIRRFALAIPALSSKNVKNRIATQSVLFIPALIGWGFLHTG